MRDAALLCAGAMAFWGCVIAVSAVGAWVPMIPHAEAFLR